MICPCFWPAVIFSDIRRGFERAGVRCQTEKPLTISGFVWEAIRKSCSRGPPISWTSERFGTLILLQRNLFSAAFSLDDEAFFTLFYSTGCFRMFTIRLIQRYDRITVGDRQVREFFADLQNFVEMMRGSRTYTSMPRASLIDDQGPRSGCRSIIQKFAVEWRKAPRTA